MIETVTVMKRELEKARKDYAVATEALRLQCAALGIKGREFEVGLPALLKLGAESLEKRAAQGCGPTEGGS